MMTKVDPARSVGETGGRGQHAIFSKFEHGPLVRAIIFSQALGGIRHGSGSVIWEAAHLTGEGTEEALSGH